MIIGSQGHDPFFISFIPPDLWISKVFEVMRIGQDRIVFVFGPGAAMIIAVGETLILVIIASCFRGFAIVMGEDGYQWWVSILAKVAGIIPVDHCAA